MGAGTYVAVGAGGLAALALARPRAPVAADSELMLPGVRHGALLYAGTSAATYAFADMVQRQGHLDVLNDAHDFAVRVEPSGEMSTFFEVAAHGAPLEVRQARREVGIAALNAGVVSPRAVTIHRLGGQPAPAEPSRGGLLESIGRFGEGARTLAILAPVAAAAIAAIVLYLYFRRR